MLNFPWLPQRADLIRRMQVIGRLVNEGRHAEALEATEEAEAVCIASGVTTSPHIIWSLAAAYDNAGDLPRALEFILRAVRMDPLDYAINNSLEIIVGKAKARLSGAPWDEATATMYERLIADELTDDSLRVAFASHLMACGKSVEALRVAQAVATLNPRSAAAWDVVEAAAEKLGDIALAMEAANSSAAAKVSVPPLRPNVACARA